jgi:hypothetical protein
MGHQVNFYLDPDDTAQLQSLIGSVEPCLFLHSRSLAPAPRIVSSVCHEEGGKRWLFYDLVRTQDVDAYYDEEGTWQEKPDAFRSWAKAVFRKTKRSLGRYNTYYIGAGAAAWVASGTGKIE